MYFEFSCSSRADLKRSVDFINAKTSSTFTIRHFRLLQLLITLGLILSIVGGTSGTVESDSVVKVAATSKVGIVMYIVAFVGILLVYFVSIRSTSVIAKQERRIPAAVVFALPLILVRLIYAACSVFLHRHLFNIVTGSLAVRVGMAIIEEFLVSAIYVAVGFLVTRVDPSAQEPIAGRDWKMKGSKSARRTGRR